MLVGGRLTGVTPGAAVELIASGTAVEDRARPATAAIQLVMRDRPTRPGSASGTPTAPSSRRQLGWPGYHLTISVTVEAPDNRVDVYSGLELGRDHPRSMFTVLQHRDPPDEFALVWLQDRTALTPGTTPGQLLRRC